MSVHASPDDGDGQPRPEPSLAELLTALAVAEAMKGVGGKLASRLRGSAGGLFLAANTDGGTKAASVRIPGIGEVGTATLKAPRPVAYVTDQAAYTAHVEKRHPAEIQRRLVIDLAADKFGVDTLAAAIRDLAAEFPGMATVREEKTVREAFQTTHLAKNVNAAALVLEEADPTSGEMVTVPGVDVVQPAATGEFAITKYTDELKARVLQAVIKGDLDLAQILGVAPLAPGIDDGRTVPGEAEEASPA